MERLEDLRNLGPTSCGWLREVGIATPADLDSMGSKLAFRLVRDRFGPRISANLLYALEAALLDLDWRELPDGLRADLQAYAASV